MSAFRSRGVCVQDVEIGQFLGVCVQGLGVCVQGLLAGGKAGSMPVLPVALSLARDGYELKLATQTPWAYELQPESGT